MNKNSYKECVPVSDVDNDFLRYYDTAYAEGVNSPADDMKHYNIGSKYAASSDWYYQWDRYEQHYYVVVDKD